MTHGRQTLHRWIPKAFLANAIVLVALAAPDAPAVGARSYDCLIEPHRIIRVGTPVEGIIESIAVERGDRVHQGQVLARLTSEVEEATVAVARARAGDRFQVDINRAQARLLDLRLGRTERLHQRGHVAETEAEEVAAEAEMARLAVSKAELELEVARLELARAEALLTQRTILSPVDGVVTERRLSPGEYRTEQSHLVTVAELDPLNVEAHVPVAEYGRVVKGTAGAVMPEKPIGGRYPAMVAVVDQVFDAASGTFGVRLELPNPRGELPAGLRCTVAFDGP